MKIKPDQAESVTVQLEDLDAGYVFEYDGQLFMKMVRFKSEKPVPAVILATGELTYCSAFINVTPVHGEFVRAHP